MSEYIRNMETGKLELHFDKADYMALSDDLKREIKSNFLFSRSSSAWVSRAKFPHLYRAECVAKKLGLTDGGKVGERLSFEEQQERKAERAEARAERYDAKADRATERGETLQSPIERMHGDIAFFTQPNINTSAGRAFTRQRDRMWSAWERGMEEFKKSDYYRDRAETARQTAKQTRPTDKAFCQRRIDDANKEIRACKRTIDEYTDILKQMDAGKEPVNKYGLKVKSTREQIEARIERANEIAEAAIDKAAYYQSCIDDLGGVSYSKDTIKPGYIVRFSAHWKGTAEVVSCGPKNFKYRAGDGWTLSASYAEIAEVVKAEERTEIPFPFAVGDVYTVKEWNGNEYAPKEYTVTKVTPDKVTVKSGEERAKAIRPRKSYRGDEWFLTICDGRDGYVTKKATA